jgi:predicted nucleic acid-binding Zn ribbon protein
VKRNMAEAKATTISGGVLVECPRCTTRLKIIRRRVPLIDSCGFESYSFECDGCGARLVGIVDPFDDKLLVSELDR